MIMDIQESYFITANSVVFRKINDYCRYQPRTHQQVRDKLYGWKLRKNVVEALLAALIEAGLVSESRFATAYAHDRYSIYQWGRNKVRKELQKRGVSSYCIDQALTQVGEEQYEETLRRLGERKWSALHGRGLHPGVRMKKTADFLIGKGYKPSVVWRLVRELQISKTPNDDS
jgi:regulatory protein